MKEKIKLLSLLFISALQGFSQNSAIDKIMIGLNSSEVFKNCIVFKNDLNSKLAQVKSLQAVDPERFNNLRLAYTEVYEKYDAFIKTVKLDLSNTENLKNLIKSPDIAAQNYATSYQAVKDAYETNFLPQYNNVVSDGSKGLPFAVLLKFGFDAFKMIANSLKTHRIDKAESINLILPLINERLFNKLKLPTWSELNIPEPGGYKNAEAVVIPTKTINSLNGSISFFLKTDGGQDQAISFTLNEGKKDIQVVSDGEEPIAANDEYFTTTESYPVGARLRMQVANSGFSYVLALNTDGIALIYPSKNITVRKTGDTKDIIVDGDETPGTGAVDIPGKGSNGNPRYFSITKNATGTETSAEELALLLSKAELELTEIIEKLNEVSGNLSERITKVFAEQKIDKDSAQLSLQESGISFNADESTNSVLPLVFKIRKQ
jgi:hypothetical protein